MSTVTNDEELGQAMTAAELTLEERELVAQTLEDSDLAADEAIAAVLALRDAEPAPAVAEQLGDEPSEAQWKTLGKENERHERRVREIMGGFVDGFETCEPCQGAGLVPPGPPEPEPQTHEYFRTCETCSGFGQVLTGSRAVGHTARNCPNCGGRGYEEKLDAEGRPLATSGAGGAPPTVSAPPPASTLEPAPALEGGAGERFGTPAWMGDPNLGA